jgi:AbrB family looped-hinge helix DNA binding protein
MGTKVGPKGQVVIEKEIRDKLGIGPGWIALQRVVEGRVEITFIPPSHNRSLKGILAPYVKGSIAPTPEAWADAREQAWADHVKERYGEARPK